MKTIASDGDYYLQDEDWVDGLRIEKCDCTLMQQDGETRILSKLTIWRAHVRGVNVKELEDVTGGSRLWIGFANVVTGKVDNGSEVHFLDFPAEFNGVINGKSLVHGQYATHGVNFHSKIDGESIVVIDQGVFHVTGPEVAGKSIVYLPYGSTDAFQQVHWGGRVIYLDHPHRVKGVKGTLQERGSVGQRSEQKSHDHDRLRQWIAEQRTVTGSTIDCEQLWASIASLQEELASAPPNKKAEIIDQIEALQAYAESVAC